MGKFNKMRTAVIGCGKISDIYLNNMTSRFDILDVVACSDVHKENAIAKASRYGIEAMTTDEILADKDIELVVNLTPPSVHYEIIKNALLSGKHVYTEKVVATTFAQALDLKQIAEEKGLYLGCAPDTFLGSGLQNGRKAIEQGLAGKITSIHAALNRDLSHIYELSSMWRMRGAGIGYDVGIYYLTALLSIFGPVKEVSGIASTVEPVRTVKNPSLDNYGEEIKIENENLMVGYLRFQDGILATIHFNGVSIWPVKPTITVYGTEGILELPDPDSFGGDTVLLKKGPAHSENKVILPNNFGYSENSRGIGVAEMAYSIRAGRKNRANIDMACHAVEVLEGIVNSSEERKTQNMTTSFEIPRGLPEGYQENYVGKNVEGALAQ